MEEASETLPASESLVAAAHPVVHPEGAAAVAAETLRFSGVAPQRSWCIPMGQHVAEPTERAAALAVPAASAPASRPRTQNQVDANVKKWQVSMQAAAKRPAHCFRCKIVFQERDIRLHAASIQKAHNRYLHLECLDAVLPAPTELEGFAELDQACRQDLITQIGHEDAGPSRGSAREAPHPEQSEAATPRSQGTLLCSADSQALTAAPEDVGLDDLPDSRTESLFSSIARLEFWDTVPWDDILCLDAQTSIFLPRGLEAAVAQVKGDICGYVEAAFRRHDEEDEVRGWKAMLAVDILLFHEAKAQDTKTRRSIMAERLTWMSTGQWGALWSQVTLRGGGGRAPPPLGLQDAVKRALEKDVKRVKSLLASGEVSRAASAAWGAAPLAAPSEVVAKLQSTQHPGHLPRLVPRNAGEEVQTTPAWDAELTDRIADRIVQGFKKYPRRAGAGPAGGRYEHYAVLTADPEAAKSVARALARLAQGTVPQGVLHAYLSARLVGLRKPTGGVRVLGCGGVSRRLGCSGDRHGVRGHLQGTGGAHAVRSSG